jgi:hypothetical protein
MLTRTPYVSEGTTLENGQKNEMQDKKALTIRRKAENVA